MSKLDRCLTALAILAACTVTQRAHAQHAVERVESTGPNTLMFRSGVTTLAISYVPAVVVAGFSDVPSDKRLYIPVAGPWINFAERDCPTCRHETFNRVLLVTDGVIQGIGALDILGSFFVVEERTYVASSQKLLPFGSSLRVAVAPIGRGYGVTTLARF